MGRGDVCQKCEIGLPAIINMYLSIPNASSEIGS